MICERFCKFHTQKRQPQGLAFSIGYTLKDFHENKLLPGIALIVQGYSIVRGIIDELVRLVGHDGRRSCSSRNVVQESHLMACTRS